MAHMLEVSFKSDNNSFPQTDLRGNFMENSIGQIETWNLGQFNYVWNFESERILETCSLDDNHSVGKIRLSN
ncbi:944_t:CDS:2 [Dentiscutata heterogama]|uniref:944_t:CDS:1 n=1 Tax=Dentiscutata heterogama TaxID=1316150 RepID=A0ACA9KKC4_9GLOM|nr:944_t:CDS:2 [Dentiscutata heterogama]